MKHLRVKRLVVMVGVALTGSFSEAIPLSLKQWNFKDLHLHRLAEEGPKEPVPFVELMVEPRQVHACIEATCGRPPENRLMTYIDDGFRWETKDFKEDWATKVQPKAEKAYRLEVQANARGAVLLAEALKDAGPLAVAEAAKRNGTLAHPIARLAIYLKILSGLQGVDGFLSVNPEGKIVVDEDVLEASIPDVGERAYLQVILEKQMIPLFGTLAITEPLDRILQRHDGLLESRLMYLYPNDSFAAALKKDSLALVLRIQKVFQVTGPVANLIFSSAQRDLVARTQAGVEMSVPEMGEYLTVATLAEMLEIVLFHLPKAPEAKAVAAIDELVATVRARQAAALPLVDFQQVEKFCRGRLNLMEATEQSEFRLRRFDNLIPHVKESALGIAREYIGAEFMPELEQRITGLKFFLPRGPRNSTTGFRKHLDKTIQGQNSTLAFYETPEAKDAILWIEIVRAVSGGDQDARVPELASFCQNLPVEPATDATNPRSGRISLSWFTVNYPDVGVGIMAHEIGHIVSGYARALPQAKEFAASLNCVANRNPFTFGLHRPLEATENTIWTEEDWSDRFSARVVKDLRDKRRLEPLKLMNFACALVTVDEVKSYGRNRLTPADNDPHSAGLLRMMMIGSDLGTLHPACAPVLENFAGKNLRCE